MPIMARKRAGSIPPRRPVPVAAAGGAADDREGRRGGADAAGASGEKLGVSRTALYRHFADKSALLAAVATEGFRTLRHETQRRLGRARGRPQGVRGDGRSLRAVCRRPSVALSRDVRRVRARTRHPTRILPRKGRAPFRCWWMRSCPSSSDGLVRADNPLELAQYIWANVHGIAMLAIDGQLKQPIDDVIRFANERMRTGIESTDPRRRVGRRVRRVERVRRVQSLKSRV